MPKGVGYDSKYGTSNQRHGVEQSRSHMGGTQTPPGERTGPQPVATKRLKGGAKVGTFPRREQ